MVVDGVSIRAARPGEEAAVLAMWRHAEAPPSRTDNVEAIARLVARDAEALLVAEREGAIVGSIIAGWDGWRGNVYRLAVAPELRRQGVALQLVRAAEAHLTAIGAARVCAQVIAVDARAMGFWRAAGYRVHEGMTRMIRDLG